MPVIVKEYQPSRALRPYVELFWSGIFNKTEVPFLSQRVVPNGYVELIVHLTDSHCELLQGPDYSPSPDYMLIGLFTKPYEAHFKRRVRVFAIRFKPEAIYHVFGIPAAEIQSNFADIECFTGRSFRVYSSRMREIKSTSAMIALSEKYLLKSIDEGNRRLYYLNRAAEIIRRSKGLISIEKLACQVYISPRQLEREFKQQIGMSPKSYMRIARLNEVNRIIQKGKRILLTNLSHACGYADQAHFIRDFKHFTGESPKVFLRERDRFFVNPNGGDVERA